jgi:hypothetical protein
MKHVPDSQEKSISPLCAEPAVVVSLKIAAWSVAGAQPDQLI